MKYRVEHGTEYDYSQDVSLSYNDACLSLRDFEYQTVFSRFWDVEPSPDFQRERMDIFGNAWRLISFERPMKHMRISTIHNVEVRDRFGGAVPQSPAWESLVAEFRSVADTGQASDTGGRVPDPDRRTGLPIEIFAWDSPYIKQAPELADFGRASFPAGRPLLEGAMDLTRRIYRDFEYSPLSTTISTPVEEVFRTRKGVCQDFAHLGIAVMRSLGIPCRYVSGYLHTSPAYGKEKVRGADASHAWFSVHVPGTGWVDFDPTNGILVGDGHVSLAWGRDYGDVTPLRGVVLGGGAQKLKVRVTVETVS